MPTARKLPSGKWFLQLRRKGFPSISVSNSSKAECERDARAIEHQLDLGTHHFMSPKAGELLLRHAFDRYFKCARYTEKRATTKKAEAGKAVQLLKHLGSYSLQNLREERIAQYRDDRMLQKTRYGRTPSPNTVRLELALLAAVFKVARQEWGIKLDSPLAQVRKPSCQEMRRDRRLFPLEEHHLLQILERQPTKRLYFLVTLILHCCLRPGEAAGIKKSNIEIEKKRVLLPRSDTKSKRPRYAILTVPAMKIITEALEVSPKDSPFLIGTRTKKGAWRPFDYSCSWNRARDELARIGIIASDLRVHDLRHEAISRLVEDTKLEDAQITAITGHVDSTTMWSYRHLRSDALYKLMDGKVQSTVARYTEAQLYPDSVQPHIEDESIVIDETLGIAQSTLDTPEEKREKIQAEIDEIIEATRGKKMSAIDEEKLEYLIRIKKLVIV